MISRTYNTGSYKFPRSLKKKVLDKVIFLCYYKNITIKREKKINGQKETRAYRRSGNVSIL